MADFVPLKIFDISPDAVLIATAQMLTRGAKQQLIRHPKNDSILPSIVQLASRTTHLSLSATLMENTPVGDFSHCWALCGGRKAKPSWILAEAGTDQHPRMIIEGSGSEKIQVYHLTFYAALLAHSNNGHPVLLTEFTEEQAEEHLAMLKRVSRKNTKTTASEGNEMTVAHICGNGFCVRPSHLRVVPKVVNEEHTHCHWMQEVNAEDKQKLLLARTLCPHDPKCTKLNYKFE
jgi:hypothetical protein